MYLQISCSFEYFCFVFLSIFSRKNKISKYLVCLFLSLRPLIYTYQISGSMQGVIQTKKIKRSHINRNRRQQNSHAEIMNLTGKTAVRIMGCGCSPSEPNPIPVVLYHLRTGIVYDQWNEEEGKTDSDLLWLAFPREPDTLMTQ